MSANVSKKDFARFLLSLSSMLEAGMTPDAGLVALKSGATASGRNRLIEALRRSISDGSTLSDACAGIPALFTPLYCAMLRAGESRGHLPEALADISRLLESQIAMRRRIILALIYPVVVLIAAFALTALSVTFVLPRMAAAYKEMQHPLPQVTLSLFSAADLFVRFSPLAGMVLAAATAGCWVFRRTSLGKVLTDWLLLRLPLAGSLNRKVVTGRFARAYGSLLAGGVNIVTAVRLAGSATGNCVAEQATINAAKRVESGEPLSTALQTDAVFLPSLSEVLVTGEKTGHGDEMLARLAKTLDDEVAAALLAIMIVIPVIGIVLLGLLVGWIVFAVMVPWLQLPSLITV